MQELRSVGMTTLVDSNRSSGQGQCLAIFILPTLSKIEKIYEKNSTVNNVKGVSEILWSGRARCP